jgi:putative ABC transport system permease protein
MSIFSLVWNYLKSKPLNTALNILLMSLGIAIITLLLLFNKQFEEKITQNTKGIDLVVGAKGSPMQLILCNIFHIDYPTGNINLREAEKIARNRLVKTAIPLALGDSFRGYRVVGTTKQYATLYNGELSTGRWWNENMEVVLGFNAAQKLKLKIGTVFSSTHGLTLYGGEHGEQKFVVKGIMQKSNTVLDNLILTSVESIWAVHDDHGKNEDQVSYKNDSSFTHSLLVSSVDRRDSTKEITAMLIKYRSPMGAIQLPRLVNSQSSLQAASPAVETTRLFTMFGVGVEILMGFGYVLIFISALSIFIALYNSLAERRYDLAIMRSMGASRNTLFKTILLEGLILTIVGSVIGLLVGHGALIVMSGMLEEIQKSEITGFVWYDEEWMILGGGLLLGLLCSFIPAIQAYRTDISKVLAGISK